MQECKNARMQECENARMRECENARIIVNILHPAFLHSRILHWINPRLPNHQLFKHQPAVNFQAQVVESGMVMAQLQAVVVGAGSDG
jgi:hypothetical protein